jgi:hypothetical protein
VQPAALDASLVVDLAIKLAVATLTALLDLEASSTSALEASRSLIVSRWTSNFKANESGDRLLLVSTPSSAPLLSRSETMP